MPDSKLRSVLIDFAREIAKAAWSVIKDRVDNEESIDKIAKAVRDAAVAAAVEAAKARAIELGITFSVEKLQGELAAVLAAFEPPANPRFGIRGLAVEEMPADWKPDDEQK